MSDQGTLFEFVLPDPRPRATALEALLAMRRGATLDHNGSLWQRGQPEAVVSFQDMRALLDARLIMSPPDNLERRFVLTLAGEVDPVPLTPPA